jgi:hypothetical protein
MEPTAYDPAITAATATHTRKRMEEEWDKKRTLWFIQKGFLCGVTMNMRNALDEQYYSQLKNINTAYRNTTPVQILEHQDTRWCPLDIKARKLLKAEFHTNWDSTVMHITAFGMKLDKEQVRIIRLGVVISDEDKLQFYMEQIYASNCFDKKEMVDWENKPVNVKDDYDQAKLYFEGLVRDFETYTQNSGEHGKKGYKSANHIADVGDKIRKYIQEIASVSVASNEKAAKFAANISEESKAKDAQFQAMTAQIQALINTVAKLLTQIAAAAKENSGGGGGGGGGDSGGGGGSGSGGGGGGSGGGGGGRRRNEQTFVFTRNMGAYCYSCGHHPIGVNHTSVTCTRKRDDHNNLTTADHRLGVSNFWPELNKVKFLQQNHPKYKGKSANN